MHGSLRSLRRCGCGCGFAGRAGMPQSPPLFCAVDLAQLLKQRLEGRLHLGAQRFGALLAQHAAQHPQLPLRILGPAPMAIAMLGGKYRYKLTLKCRNDAAFRALLRRALDDYAAEKLPQKATVVVDLNTDGDL